MVTIPLGAKGADLVVWWEKGFYPQENEAVAEVIAAFELGSGKEVERSSSIRRPIFWTRSWGRWSARQPPDFTFQLWLLDYFQQWARDDRLVDLSDSVGSFSDLFDSDAPDWATRFSASTGRKAF